MNSKNIAKSLHAKVEDWLKTIDDEDLVKELKKNVLITGGALVSLINNETPNDYDVYLKTLECCEHVAKYYADRWNSTHKTTEVRIQNDGDRIRCFIQSEGAAIEDGESCIDDTSEPDVQFVEDTESTKPKYRPRYFSTNAISLSDKIQIVIRFWGPVEEIHKNYDFVHCTCSYDFSTNTVNLPQKALECIINKELVYSGSRYPLCSIIRTRKYIQRGYSINAGQYLKMCLQLNELNLKDLNVFKDQLTGVDSAYFEAAISAVLKKKEEDPSFEVDNEYLFEIINRIF